MRIVMFVGTVVLMLLLYWFINHTRIGTAIRAVAIDQDTAKLMGINVDNIISMIFLIGPALGGAAGVMMGLYYGQITYDMGFSFGLKAFTAAIMGGIGNIPGRDGGGHPARRARSHGRGLRVHRVEGCHSLPCAHPYPHFPPHRFAGEKGG